MHLQKYFAIFLLLILSACSTGPSTAVGAHATVESIPSIPALSSPTVPPSTPRPNTATQQPASPTPTQAASHTPTPTASPTATFTHTPTATQIPLERLTPISLSNVAQLSRLAYIPANLRGPLSASFAFSSDSRQLALDGGASVQIWDITTGQVIRELIPPAGLDQPAGSLAVSPDGNRAARVYGQDQIVIWNLKTGEIIKQLSAGPKTQALYHLTFPIASRLAASAATLDGTGLAVWDVENGELISESASSSYQADGFTISPQGRLVVQVGKGGTLRFWDPQNGKLKAEQIIYACQDTLSGAAFSPDGYLLVLQCETEGARLYLYVPNYYRIGDLDLLNVQDSALRGNGQMTFNRDGALLAMAIGSPPRQILLWDMRTRSQLLMIDALPADIRQITFSPDGRFLAFRLGDGSIELWGVPVL